MKRKVKRKMTRTTTFLVAFMVIISVLAVSVLAATQRFKDVPQNKWYYKCVENLAARKIINGYPNGYFRPNNRVERQHVCVMVAKAAVLSSQGERANFPDVARNNETSPFIAALQKKGAIKGYPDGNFKPRKSVTRAEIAAIIAKSFDIKSAGTAGGLKDIVGHWGEKMIRRLASNGIVDGYPDGTYRPNATVTRAELAKMITRAMEVAAKQKGEVMPSQPTAKPESTTTKTTLPPVDGNTGTNPVADPAFPVPPGVPSGAILTETHVSSMSHVFSYNVVLPNGGTIYEIMISDSGWTFTAIGLDNSGNRYRADKLTGQNLEFMGYTYPDLDYEDVDVLRAVATQFQSAYGY